MNALERFNAQWLPEPNSGCWLWTGTVHDTGYGSLRIGGGKRRGAHRMSYELFCGAILPGLRVCHRCDVRLCVNPAHLFLGTAQDNTDDMMVKERHRTFALKGGANGRAKLSEADVLAIRASRLGVVRASRAFGVSPSQIHSIRQRTSWSHI